MNKQQKLRTQELVKPNTPSELRNISYAQLKVQFHHSLPWLHAGFVGTQLWQVWHPQPMLNTLSSSPACIPEAGMNNKHNQDNLEYSFLFFLFFCTK